MSLVTVPMTVSRYRSFKATIRCRGISGMSIGRQSPAIHDWDAACAASPWGRADARMLTGSDRVREIEEEFLTDDDRRDYDTTWGH